MDTASISQPARLNRVFTHTVALVMKKIIDCLIIRLELLQRATSIISSNDISHKVKKKSFKCKLRISLTSNVGSDSWEQVYSSGDMMTRYNLIKSE